VPESRPPGEQDPRTAPADDPTSASASAGRVARAKVRVEQGRTRAEAAFRKLESARASNQVVDVGFHLYDRDNASGGAVLAGALAFRLFVFVVPYAFVFITIFGSAADLQGQSGTEAAKSAGLTGVIAKSVADAKRQSDSVKVISLLVGVYALYLAARGVVKTTRAVHALAWRVRLPRLRRSWRAALLVVGVVLAASAIATAGNAVRANGILAALLVDLFALVVWGAAWLGLSMLLPRDPRAPWTALIPGALLFGLATAVMHFVTVVYFARKVSSASDTYGAIGAAIGILLAMYVFGRVISGSAVLNATIWERKQAQASG
jgi:uncharacterized BrkB/YihY/UPF0761 family membrane protein